MLKKITFAVASVAVVGLGFSGTAEASSLLGDNITFESLFPNADTLYFGPQNITVTADSSDTISPEQRFLLDPNASGFSVDYQTFVSWTPSSFNGFKLSSLNFNDFSSIIGFDFDTNLSGLTASRFSFTEDSFSVNWQGLSANTDTYLNVSFKTSGGTSEPEAVPEPMSTLAFLAVGAVAAGGALKKK